LRGEREEREREKEGKKSLIKMWKGGRMWKDVLGNLA